MNQTSLLSDLRILYHLALAPVRGATHAERLESFYQGQAEDYDRFRRKLLHGREELIASLPLDPGTAWVDIGGGTGANIAAAGARLLDLSQVTIVDLAPSLLRRADERIKQESWANVSTCLADATQYTPPQSVDVVTCSYSLTMIPDWFAAIERAWEMLKPGGVIGVVDFYVARKHATEGHRRHGWFTRTAIPAWFASDNVHLNPDHIPYLERRFETVSLSERRGSLPWLPFVTAPYYLFVGRKRA